MPTIRIKIFVFPFKYLSSSQHIVISVKSEARADFCKDALSRMR